MFNVKNCADVTDCSLTSWDLLFCICNGGGCTPALGRDPSNGAPSSAVGYFDLGLPNADPVAGLVGIYSTTATAVTTFRDPLVSWPPTGPWTNINNVLQDDGSYASITGNGGPSGECPVVSDYLQVTGWNFSIPSGSVIRAIGLGVKGHFNPSGGNTSLGNFALMLNGTPYWFYDPRAMADGCLGLPTSPAPPYGTIPQAQDPGDCCGEAIGTTDIHLNALDNVVGLAYMPYGQMPGCTGHPLAFQHGPSPIFKSFPCQLKQSWSPAEVNDNSFGLAVNWGVDPLGEDITMFLDCFGIAIYYTPGAAPAPPKRRPNVCINM